MTRNLTDWEWTDWPHHNALYLSIPSQYNCICIIFYFEKDKWIKIYQNTTSNSYDIMIFINIIFKTVIQGMNLISLALKI